MHKGNFFKKIVKIWLEMNNVAWTSNTNWINFNLENLQIHEIMYYK